MLAQQAPSVEAAHCGSDSLVQIPLNYTLKENCTTQDSAEAKRSQLVDSSLSSIREEFDRVGHVPTTGMYGAIEDVFVTLEDMADGFCLSEFMLSSLDPGVGKTTAVKHFIRHFLLSPDYMHAAVLVCLPRIAELTRLVAEMDLDASDFAVLTSDKDANSLSTTPVQYARVLFTTHQMIRARCGERRFAAADAFHYRCRPREVRIWDEEMLPGEVITLSTDALGSLLAPLRSSAPKLADLVSTTLRNFEAEVGNVGYKMPDVVSVSGVEFSEALKALERSHLQDGQPIVPKNTRMALETLYQLSGRYVRLSKDHRSVISALDTRETLPADLAPILILDASGRVRETYQLWEKALGGLIRLKEAPKNYCNLTISVMDQGGGKDAWRRNGDQLLNEVVCLINTKPDEKWLVVHHKDALGGKLKQRMRELIAKDAGRISFVHWGAHQGTNAFGDIPNVILAGTLFLPEQHYLGLARLCTGIPPTEELPDVAYRKTVQGELRHLILQALCRGSVRRNEGDQCAPCNAYIIASKRSGIRGELSTIFPGCVVKQWRAVGKKLKGQKAAGIDYVREFFNQDPGGTLEFRTLKEVLDINNTSNFNKTIRRHNDFKDALESLGLVEVTKGDGPRCNAWAKLFPPIPGAYRPTAV